MSLLVLQAKGVLPEDVEESIERAIEAHDGATEISTSAADKIGIEKPLEIPASAADTLAGSGKGATSAQKAAVTGDTGLIADEEEVDILEALEEVRSSHLLAAHSTAASSRLHFHLFKSDPDQALEQIASLPMATSMYRNNCTSEQIEKPRKARKGGI